MRKVEAWVFITVVMLDTLAVFVTEQSHVRRCSATLGAAAFLACGALLFMGTIVYNKKLDRLNYLMWPFFRNMAKRHPGVYWKVIGWFGLVVITASLARQLGLW
jgi:hypothetical protein